jgi:hypothetical protein
MKASILFGLILAIFSTGMVEAKVRSRSKFEGGDEQKQRRLVNVKIIGADPTDEYPLARCQGDCDIDDHCEAELVCHQRDPFDPVPGCSGGTSSSSRTDYCVDPNDISSGPTPPVASPASSPVTPATPLSSTNFRTKLYSGPTHSAASPGAAPLVFPSGPTPTVASPTSSPVTPATPSSLTNFHLKLYWEEGYDWQEEDFERKWCMECRNGDCNSGDKLYIYECSESSQSFDFVVVNNDEVLIRLSGTGLCLQRNNNDIFIKSCNAGNSNHKWFAKVGAFDQNRFEISQKTYSSSCITQRHHPKAGEEVEIESCETARNGLTSFWNRD